jgi:preprotein translocase subunit SecE
MAKNNTPAKQESGIKIWWGNAREYFSSVYNELKKVYWPNRRQLIGYTSVVLITVAIDCFDSWGFDSGLSYLLSKF